MDKGFERDILGRLTRRELREWEHWLRVLLERLVKIVHTRRELNRMVMYIQWKLRIMVKINQLEEEKEKRL